MKLYGSLSRLVSILFRKDSQDITVRPNQGTTYTAARDIQLPPGDAAHVLASADSTQTFTNKTISGASNTISNVSLTAGVTGTLPVANGGTNSASALNNNRLMQSSGGAIVEASAITASRALVSDANGIPVAAAATTTTEIGYLNGVTSSIQTQFGGKASTALDNLTVGSLAAGSLLVGSSGSAVSNLAVGTNGQVLTVVAGSPAWAAASGEQQTAFKTDWVTLDGTSKVVTHSFASNDFLCQIFDTTTGQRIDVDTEVRTDTNTLTLTASEAPAASWRVLLLKI